MKKIISALLIVFSLFLLYACGGGGGSVTTKSLELTYKEDQINVGEEFNIRYKVEPSNEKVTFDSSNPFVASVDTTGKVKGLLDGATTITLKLASDTTIQVSFRLVVVEATCEHESTSWSFDANTHYRICTKCGERYNQAAHNFVEYGDHLRCTICGYEKAIHNHHSDEYHWDENIHWKECDECGERFSEGSHTFEDIATGKRCTVCGYVKTNENPPHEHGGYTLQSDEHNHWKVCDECGEIFDLGAHHSNTYEIDCDTYATHYQFCEECGAKFNEAAHTFIDDGEKIKCSVCGYIDHTHIPSETWEYDANAHYHTCLVGCDARFDEAAHTFEEIFNGRRCTVCGYEETEAPHDHHSDTYHTDENFHWKECDVCGELIESGVHTFEDNGDAVVCTVCGYVEHVHEYLDNWWDTTEDVHYHQCLHCDKQIDVGEHDFLVDGPFSICKVCGYTIDATNMPNYLANEYFDDATLYLTQKDFDLNQEYNYQTAQKFIEAINKDNNLGILNGGRGIVRSHGYDSGPSLYSVKNYQQDPFMFDESLAKISNGNIEFAYEISLHEKYQKLGNILYRTVGDHLEITNVTKYTLDGLMIEYLIIEDDNNCLSIDWFRCHYHNNNAFVLDLVNPGTAKVRVRYLNGDKVLDEFVYTIVVYEANDSIGSTVSTIEEALYDPYSEHTIRGYILYNSILVDETGYVFLAPSDITDTGECYLYDYVELTGNFYQGYYNERGINWRFSIKNARVIAKETYNNDANEVIQANNLKKLGMLRNLFSYTMFLDYDLYAAKANDQNSDIVPIEFIYWGYEEGEKKILATSFDNDANLPVSTVSLGGDVTGIYDSYGNMSEDFVENQKYLFKGYLIQTYENWEHSPTPSFLIIETFEPITDSDYNTAPTAIIANDVSLKQYETTYVDFHFDNENVYKDKAVTFASSNTDIFTVNYEGKITAVGVGGATLTVTSSGGLVDTCTVTVLANEKGIAITNMNFESNLLQINVGENKVVPLTIYPLNATLRDIAYEISDNTVLRVENGKLVGLKQGFVTLTASINGLSCTTRVLVNSRVENFGFNITDNGADPTIHDINKIDDIYDVLYDAIYHHYSQTTLRVDYAMNMSHGGDPDKDNLWNFFVATNRFDETGLDTMISACKEFNNVDVSYSSETEYDYNARNGYFTFQFNISYLADSATLEENYAVSHMNYYGITNVKTYIDQHLRPQRSLDFNAFPLFSSNKGTLDVTNSEELVYALERGYLPHFTIANSSAEHLYNKMQAVLRTIITTDMDDNMKMLAIYEYICSLPRNQYVEYFRITLADIERTVIFDDDIDSTYLIGSVDHHKYITEYLEAWDSEYGVGQGCMSKLLVCLLALEGFDTFRDYQAIESFLSIDETTAEIVRFYMPLVILDYADKYYILAPQDDKYLDCTSLYSEMLYTGFMRSPSMFAMSDLMERARMVFTDKVYGYKQEIFVPDYRYDDARLKYGEKVNYSFGTKQYGSDTYDYIIGSKEEMTHLFNNIKESGFRGLGYVTIKIDSKFSGLYETLCQGIEASDVDFVESFGYTHIKEAGDLRGEEDLAHYVNMIDSSGHNFNGYILSPYDDHVVYCDAWLDDQSYHYIARTIVITFNIK